MSPTVLKSMESSAREVVADTPNGTVITRPPSGPAACGARSGRPAAGGPTAAKHSRAPQTGLKNRAWHRPSSSLDPSLVPQQHRPNICRLAARSAAANSQYVGIPQPSLSASASRRRRRGRRVKQKNVGYEREGVPARASPGTFTSPSSGDLSRHRFRP